MRFRIRIAHAVIAAVNAAALIGAAVITAAGSSMARAQSYNYAAEVWKGSSKQSYTQVSCFFPEGSGELTTDIVAGVSADVRSALQKASVTAEEGQKLIPEAYSAPLGKYTVTGDIIGRSDAELTAVGGDFFLFRQFELLSGAYFSSDDIMQDGAVIERTLAFSLYGSSDVAGKNIYINGVPFYIAGVIADPETKADIRCAGKTPRAYISYEAAGELAGGYDEYGSTGFKDITCYECIIPDPVDGFAYKTIKEHFTGSSAEIVNNTTRFKPSVRVKKYKKLSDYAIRSSKTALPYWENASRLVEFDLTRMYFTRRLLLVILAVTLLWLLILGIKAAKKQFRRFADFVLLRLSHVRWRILKRLDKHKEKKWQKKVENTSETPAQSGEENK